MTNTIIPYSENNLQQMSDDGLAKMVLGLDIIPCQLTKALKNHHPQLLAEIVRRTSFLDSFFESNGGHTPIMARLYCLTNNVNSHPICSRPDCENKVNWSSGEQKFKRHCSRRCSTLDPEVQKKSKETSQNLYGCTHAMKRKDFQKKQQDTMERRHGVRFPMQVEEAKQKARRTFRQHFGVDWVTQSNDVKAKSRQTMVERHGVEFALQSQKFKEKSESTCLEHHGVKHPSQSKRIQQKIKETNEERYGVEQHLSAKSIRDKIRQTMQNRYGCDSYMETDEFNKKSKETCQRKWNVDYYQQSEEYYKNRKWKYTNPKYPDMTFATSWEFKVYDFLTEHNIPFEYQPAISIPYEYEGTHHTYHPDFKVNDRIVEVKGDQFFRMNESTGQEEMFCPWRGDLSDEEYEWRCGLEEAKHQCMVQNDVIIIRKTSLDDLEEILLT